MLLSSGVDIHNALSIVTTDFEKKREIELISKIIAKLVSGRNFSDSIEDSEAFSKLDISVVRIGENTGRLTDSLGFLADYYNRKIKQRTLVLNAVSYPIFVLVFAVLAVGFLLNNVVPIFSTIYQRFGGELPLITKLVVGISNRMPLLFLLFFLIVCLIITTVMLYRANKRVNKIIANVLLALPLIKTIIMVNFLERFSRVMSMLVNSKVPLVESISLCRNTVSLSPLQDALARVEIDILTGAPFGVAIEKTKLFPRRVVSLVKMGEEVNQLDSVFTNLANQYAQIQEKRMKQLGTYLEPLLIVIIGALVGLILVSIYLPMFKLGGQFV